MSEIESFPPIVASGARLLILGSIPGEASLRAQQYYAHPRNQFWPILGDLLGFDPQADYSVKTKALRDAGIALWDVVKSCQRPGSLDSNIAKHTVVANDFAGLLREHPGIGTLFFNGAAAEQIFRRLVLPNLNADGLQLLRLPSSSPAHAGMNQQRKLEVWRVILPLLRA